MATLKTLLAPDMKPGGPRNIAAVAAALDRYLGELYQGNRRFGLIAKEDAADRHRLFVRHLLDCVAPWREIVRLVAESGRRRLYDLGSGAGLPGLPIALVLGEVLDETVLVERREKRVSFLRGAVPVVLGAYRRTASEYSTDPASPVQATPSGISPPPSRITAQAEPVVRVLSVDADNLVASERGSLGAAIVVFRAFRQTTEDTLASLSAAFPPETPVCAFKGKIEQTSDEAARIHASGWAMTNPKERAARVVPVDVPGLEAERSLLVWYTARREIV